MPEALMARAKQEDPAIALAEKMLQTLESLRSQGPGSYPLTLKRLGELADAQALPELIAKAGKKKLFKDRVAQAKLDKTTSLVAFVGDHALLAADPRVLESAIQAAYPKKPAAQPVARLAAKVAPELRAAFEEAVLQRIRASALPAGIGVLGVDGAARLYLRDRPPEDVAAAELGVRLLQTLESARSRGPEHYPPTLKQLLETAAPQASARVLKKALAGDMVQKELILAVSRHPETPVALKADVDRLAASRQMLEFLLVRAAKPAVKAFPVKDLQKPLTESVRQPFADAVNLYIERGKLPPTVGCLWIKTRYLFLTRDVQGNRAGSAAATSAEKTPADRAADFPGDFAAAFERLDRQSGGRNFVTLVELRQALPLPRSLFDAELFKLRQAGCYRLSAAEGRHGISPEERDSGIHEEGSLLLFVSRNAS